MDGLIINQPFAEMILNGQKKWELRSRNPPENKINSEIFLLSKGNILGTIKIRGSTGPLNVQDLEKNHSLHKSDTSFLDDDFTSYAWEIDVCRIFDEPKKYQHPMGARVWVKNVLPTEEYVKGKITTYCQF